MLTQNALHFLLCVSDVKSPAQRFVTIVGEAGQLKGQ